MRRLRLLLGLAGAFAAMTAALAVAGALYNLAILAPAALFGVVTYFLWMHGTGRLITRVYRRVEQRAAANGGRSVRGGTGDRRQATRDERTKRNRQRRARQGRRAHNARGGRARRTNGGQRTDAAPDGTARREARAILGVDQDADQERIRAAYRERVKEVHPDAEDGDREAFKRVRDAYERLRE